MKHDDHFGDYDHDRVTEEQEVRNNKLPNEHEVFLSFSNVCFLKDKNRSL